MIRAEECIEEIVSANGVSVHKMDEAMADCLKRMIQGIVEDGKKTELKKEDDLLDILVKYDDEWRKVCSGVNERLGEEWMNRKGLRAVLCEIKEIEPLIRLWERREGKGG